ncbi:MAG: hypothetical protein KJO31_17325 [Gammaproteobacteria bacterium]|nr:hypothetical protein [Gammaproteobacteria bacterium]
MPESPSLSPGTGNAFTIKSMLVPLLRRPRIAQAIKWIVYGSLVINFGIYLFDDWTAFNSSLPADAPLADVLERFTTSVDMLAWLGLVFLFELETYVLPDEAFKPWVIRAFLIARVVCYVSIFFAAYGYTAETLENYDIVEVPGVSSLCQLADQGRYVQVDSIEYVEISAQNCASIASGSRFFQIANEVSVIDAPTLAHVQWIGWVDVVNAVVWLIVVALIEIEVWLQTRDQFSSTLMQSIRQIKTLGYLVLSIDAVVWLVTGYPMYAWDSFLWIFGFWAIELNLAEWELDRVAQLRAAASAS